MIFFFLFLHTHKKKCCEYSLEAPWQDTSNAYPQHTFENKIITETYLYNFDPP